VARGSSDVTRPEKEGRPNPSLSASQKKDNPPNRRKMWALSRLGGEKKEEKPPSEGPIVAETAQNGGPRRSSKGKGGKTGEKGCLISPRGVGHESYGRG